MNARPHTAGRAEAILGEAPIDNQRVARFVLTPAGLRVRTVHTPTGKILLDKALPPTLVEVRRVMEESLKLRDKIFGDGPDGGLFLLGTDGAVTRASPDRLDTLARDIVEEVRRRTSRPATNARRGQLVAPHRGTPRPNPPRPVMNAAFARWFAGSQVVEPNGQPKVLYHGTRSPTDFEVFRTGTIIEDDADEIDVQGSGDPGAYLGPHFAEEPSVASAFALGRAAAWDRTRHVRQGVAAGRVIPVVVSLRKVKNFDSEAEMLEWIVTHGESRAIEEEIFAMGEEGEVEVDEDGDVPEGVYASYDARMAALKRLQHLDVDEGNPHEDAAEELAASAREALLKLGFDGVRYRNEIEGGTGWVALVPGTVKSALGNNGNWDRNDPSIVG